MKVVIDYFLKIVQIVVMPLVLKVLDNIFKYFHEKYKKDEAFKERVDDVLRRVAAKVDPVKLMNLYMEYKVRTAPREAEKKTDAKKKKAPKPNPEPPVSTEQPKEDEAEQADLKGVAAETARLSYEASKRASKKAAGFLSRWGRKAGEWLKEETGLNEDPEAEPKPEPAPESKPSESSDEDREIDELKQRISDEQAKKERQTQPTEPAPPQTPVAPPKPPTDGKAKQPPKDGDENASGEENPNDKDDGPPADYSNDLDDLLRKERG